MKRLCLALVLSSLNASAQEAPAFASLPDPGPSVIAMPLRVNLEALFAEAERTAPRTPPGVDTWAPLPEGKKPGMRLRYNLYREALSLRMNGPRITVRTKAHYWMEVGVHVAGALVKSMGSCGLGKEGHREVILGADAEVGFTPDWGLDVKTSVQPPLALNPCQVTFLGYDITDQVVKGMQDEMAKAGGEVARQLKATALLRQKAEAAWSLLSQPVELAPGIHLAVNPERIRLSPLRTEQGRLVVTPEVSARPTLTFGPRPAVAARPLPALEALASPVSPGFRIRVESEVPFDRASEQLAKQVVGRTFETEKGKFEITDAKVRGEAGKAILDIAVKGRIKGRLTLSGRPVVDLATNTVQLRDLDYTLDSRSWITRAGEWLFRSTLRQMLQEKANFFMVTGMKEAKGQVEAHLNRPLMPGLTLRGELKDLRLEQPKVLSDRFRIEANLEGRLEAEVTDLAGLAAR